MGKKLSDKERLARATEALAKLELPVPREIKSFFKHRVEPSIGRGYEYVEYICERNGLLLQRVFCFELFGLEARKGLFAEIGRRYEGGEMVLSNVYPKNYYMGPYLPDHGRAGIRHESGWMPERTHKIKASANTSVSKPFYCVNKEKWLKRYPYCEWENYRGTDHNFFNYLCRYRKQPKIELLVKAGYDNFTSSTRLLNINGKSFKEIFKVKQDFAEEYLKKGTVSDLLILRKHEWINSVNDLVAYKNYQSELNGYYKDRYAGMTDRDIRYLIAQKRTLSYYHDYLEAAAKLGYPLAEKRYRYPDDLQKAHDAAAKEVSVITNREKNESIRELSIACQDLSYEKDGFMIFPLSCAEDLINESKALNHCVRTYVDKVAKHDSLIMFVRKVDAPETPYVTVELVPEYGTERNMPLGKQFTRITQVYGEHDKTPDEETRDFVLAWKRKYHLSGWAA